VDRQGSRAIRPAFDPRLSERTQRWLTRLVSRAAHPADLMAVEYLGPTALICCIVGALVSDLATWWLAASVLSAVVTAFVHREVTSAGLRRCRGQFVEPSALDAGCCELLCRAQRAVDAVLGSQVYRTGLLNNAAGTGELKGHEWEIAIRLRDIAQLRAEHASSISGGVPGPRASAVLGAHLRAVTIAHDATLRRVSELERYAAEVAAADAALQDWEAAEELTRRNDYYLDLAARSAADELAIAEITALAEQAVSAHEAFRDSLHHAALAAGALSLPEREA
jgi:hypothetical protein